MVTEPSFPDDPKANAYELIRTAQIALYRSKSRQRSSDSVVVFDDSMRSAVDDHHRLMADLPDAIEKSELFLHFQPIIRLPTLELAGFEALVRWIHPQLGFVPPTHFIPIAEEKWQHHQPWAVCTSTSHRNHDRVVTARIDPNNFFGERQRLNHAAQ